MKKNMSVKEKLMWKLIFLAWFFEEVKSNVRRRITYRLARWRNRNKSWSKYV